MYFFVADLKYTGYRKVNMRSDGEPARLALLRAIATGWDIHCIPQVSAPGNIQSHGVVENAVKLTKGQIRTLKSSLERKLGQPIPHGSPLIS